MCQPITWKDRKPQSRCCRYFPNRCSPYLLRGLIILNLGGGTGHTCGVQGLLLDLWSDISSENTWICISQVLNPDWMQTRQTSYKLYRLSAQQRDQHLQNSFILFLLRALCSFVTRVIKKQYVRCKESTVLYSLYQLFGTTSPFSKLHAKTHMTGHSSISHLCACTMASLTTFSFLWVFLVEIYIQLMSFTMKDAPWDAERIRDQYTQWLASFPEFRIELRSKAQNQSRTLMAVNQRARPKKVNVFSNRSICIWYIWRNVIK